jgi:putative ABC transport system ATP-binding protein
VRVVLENVGKSFGSVMVFRGINAVMQAHRLTAVVGPSGSGKTTLLAAIAGFESLDLGRVQLVEELGVHSPDPRNVAWISQSVNSLPARSVLDNVLIGPLAHGYDFDEALCLSRTALDAVGMLKRSEATGRELSGGELQRICFARAIASHRPLILADEPSSSLDQANTLILASILRDLDRSSTIIYATHDPVLMAAADDIVSMLPIASEVLGTA